MSGGPQRNDPVATAVATPSRLRRDGRPDLDDQRQRRYYDLRQLAAPGARRHAAWGKPGGMAAVPARRQKSINTAVRDQGWDGGGSPRYRPRLPAALADDPTRQWMPGYTCIAVVYVMHHV